MPLGYFQKVDPTDPMNCSAYSLAQRLLPSWEGDFTPFYYVDVAGDYSIPVILLKTATFDLVGKLVPKGPLFAVGAVRSRSEERRVGKECRSRWSPYH